MEQLSLTEKFKVLFFYIFQHPLFIVLLLVPVIIFLLQKKHGKKAFIFVYLLVILFVLYIGGEVIFELFDNLMNGLFMTLYFPNFITLFVVVVLCSIIALISFFNRKMYKVNKIINITGFAIIQMLFVLILTVVRSKNIDIYADNALYSNNDVLTLMQLLIGTFALQVIAILIINAINKVTDILDKRSTPLAENITEEISNLEKTRKTNTLGLIKNIDIDNTKVGYINVADKKNTSKPRLKPFKFDMDKLESITLNVKEKPIFDNLIEPVQDNFSKEEDRKTSLKNVGKTFKNVKNNFEEKALKKKRKDVLLPKERSEAISSKKPNLLKPMEDVIDVSFGNVSDFNKSLAHTKKFIKNNVKPDLNDSEDVSIKVISEVDRPKLVRKEYEESMDLVDNLKILDIQSTLDTVIKYKLMKGASVQIVEDNDIAVDKLQIPNFDYMLKALNKYKLYKRI